MPAIAHLFCHFIFGASAAWWARRAPSLYHQLFGWPLCLAYLLAALLLVPVATYGVRTYPSHALGYALSPELYPALLGATGLVSLCLVVANLSLLLLGFALMRAGLLRNNRALMVLPIAAASTAICAYLSYLGPLAWRFGSYSTLWAGQASPWSQTPSAWATLGAYAICFEMSRRLSAAAGDRALHWP